MADDDVNESGSWTRMGDMIREIVNEVLDSKAEEWKPAASSEETPPPKSSSSKTPGFLFESFFGKGKTPED